MRRKRAHDRLHTFFERLKLGDEGEESMNAQPTICNAVQLEAEFEERLRAAGTVRTVDGRGPRADVLAAVSDADGILLSPALNVDAEFLDEGDAGGRVPSGSR